MKWYESLNRSPLNPPSYVFGIVWPILYTTMLVTTYLVLTNKKCKPYCRGIVFFGIQLLFNLMWTTLFFRLRKPLIALIDLSVIIVFMALALSEFYKLSVFVFWLNIPYMAWLLFAWYLNAYIVLNN